MTSIGRVLILGLAWSRAWAGEISITIDDPHTRDTPHLTARERDDRIRAALGKHKLQAALFVCGMRVDDGPGRELLGRWDDAGHLIANHSYSHLNFNSGRVDVERYRQDFLRVEPLIASQRHFVRLYRFPYLKEGDTAAKRDAMRAFLGAKGYRPGHVSVDASDWYVDERLSRRLAADPGADLTGYRDYYLRHIWDRAQYYDRLATQLLHRPVRHVLLLHHNLLNALFLDDLLSMFEARGWQLIAARKAFRDPVYRLTPDNVPAGESIIWALARQSGRFESQLRYPAEDGDYERDAMDQAGL